MSILPSIISTSTISTLSSRRKRGSCCSAFDEGYYNADKLEQYEEKVNVLVRKGEMSREEAQEAIENKKRSLIASHNCRLLIATGLVFTAVCALWVWGMQENRKHAATSQGMKDAFQKEPSVTVTCVDPSYQRHGLTLELDATGDGIADYRGYMGYNQKATTSELGATKSGAEWMRSLVYVDKLQSM